MDCTDNYSQHSSMIWSVWPNGWVFVYELSRWRFESRCSHLNFRYPDIQPKIDCHKFTLKCVRDMITTYSQMRRTGKYSQHSSVIWLVWAYGWVFVFEVRGCRFESSCSHPNLRYRPCFEQEVSWHSAKIEWVLTLKYVGAMITTYSQGHHTDK